MSFPLCVLPSEKMSTPSSFMARTMAVVVTARPSGVVLKYLRPATPRWNAPHWMAINPSRTSASRQSTSRAAFAPCWSATGGMSEGDSSSGWARSAV